MNQMQYFYGMLKVETWDMSEESVAEIFACRSSPVILLPPQKQLVSLQQIFPIQ